MKDSTMQILEDYIRRNSYLKEIKEEIVDAFHMLLESFQNGHKLLVCGNGGSNSDADHIVGELLKGFQKKRKVSSEDYTCFGEEGIALANQLQDSLPAINLGAQTSILTAIINDLGGELIFAQQVVGLGQEGDVLIGISTSGNSKNVLFANMVAKTKGMKSIALTGKAGGKMAEVFDCAIKVPSSVTCEIQDMHTPVYHILCAMIEAEFWDE
ncbi:D-sedoheptulose-7-phosphate isomerase [Anaerosporobacter faecicola]|uniref:D-sedoheptulose-7-phosphate isomerase n=1 Tax=Anaerosporobacter faecicola TaxID=2718714 RepID=UPI0014397160|nr:SIS domain-containing protein [Anaerosporobacter faecicola]